MASRGRLDFYQEMMIRSLENRVIGVEHAIRNITTDVRRRYEEAVKLAPTEDEDEETLEGYRDYLEGFSDEHAEAEDVVEASLGALLVLIFAHVEGCLKHIWATTRSTDWPKRATWPQFLDLYSAIGIDLRAIEGYAWTEAVNHLNNSFKHANGELRQRFVLPDGTAIEAGQIDYNALPYRAFAREATKFLTAAGRLAASPACPRVKPRFRLEPDQCGKLRLTWITDDVPWRESRMPFPVEVWTQCDGDPFQEDRLQMRLVETRPDFELMDVNCGRIHVRCRYINSRYEVGPWSDVLTR